jgi:hypothetical protein
MFKCAGIQVCRPTGSRTLECSGEGMGVLGEGERDVLPTTKPLWTLQPRAPAL